MNYKISLLFLLFLSSLVLAETTNTTSYWNITAATGITGTTLLYCNATADCSSYTCFLDWDSTSAGGYQGWCNATSITSCYNNGTAYSTGYYECASATTRRTCSSGTWSTETCSGSCSSGNCTAAASSSSSSGGSSSSSINTTAPLSSIRLVSTPVDFSITQNESVTKTAQAKNNGNKTLYNVTLSLTGIESSWFKISPDKFNSSSKDATNTFTINISVPENADVKTYLISINVTTSNSSVYATANFSMKVLPSNKTVETEILPRYNEYSSLIPILENNITTLKQKGANTTEMESILSDIKSKIIQADSDIKNQSYFAAKQNLDEIKILIDNLNSKIDSAKIPEPEAIKSDFILYAVIIVIIAVAGILLYLFWPIK